MITFVRNRSDLDGAQGELRAGGTDLQDRRRKGISTGPVVDLRDLDGRDAVTLTAEGGLSLGSGLSIQGLADHPDVQRGWPGLAQAAGELATPQIRARGTLGGNLLQRVRCWYYRDPGQRCLKSGGGACLARAGEHRFHASHDAGGACIAPHASTLAVALTAFDATVTLRGRDGTELVLTVPELLGDGRDATRDHALPEGAFLVSVELPPPVEGERSAYFRAASRSRADWPLVEAAARLQVDDQGRVSAARVVLGGVTNRPLDSPAAAGLVGDRAREEAFLAAGARAVPDLPTLPGAAWKASLIAPVFAEVLLHAQAGPPAAWLPSAPAPAPTEAAPETP